LQFLTPRNLENHAPMQAGARFSQNQLFELGLKKTLQNDATLPPRRPALQILGPLESLQNSACLPGRFLSDLWTQNGAENVGKSSPRASQGPPEARFLSHTASGLVFCCFFDPPEPRKSCSRVSGSTIFTKSAVRPGGQKSTPK